MATAGGSQKPAVDLDSIPEEQLLDTRISDLPVRIEGTWLEERVAQLYRELEAKNIVFRPQFYLADEWLTPEDDPVVGIPFYLAHPRLIALEKKMMREAEGETVEWCMKLMRHETGHALTYAYHLNRKPSWQKVFGKSSQPYEETYRFRPHSKSFVRHLGNYYAQYHPDEDFVETFAVWLTPGFDWRKEYKGWKGACEKLTFVDRLMQDIAGKPPIVKSGRQYWKAANIRSTLRRYYQKKRLAEAESFPEFHDAKLKRLFIEGAEQGETRRSVATLLQSHRKSLLATAAEMTGERRYMADEVFKAIYRRSKTLRLVTEEPEPVAVLKLATYLSTLLMNYRYTNRLRGIERGYRKR
jgi:hypothetical protein